MLATRVPVTTDIATRLVHADAALWIDWMLALRSLPGNPYGVSVQTERDAALLHVHAAPLPYYNRLLALGTGATEALCHAQDFFRQRQTPFRVDVSPFTSGPDLLRGLGAMRFTMSEFQTNLYGILSLRQRAYPSEVTVREVRAKEFPFFARLYERAYYGVGAPKRLAAFRIDSIHARFRRRGWRFYMAFVGGIPSGGAALFIQDGVATLAGGATMIKFRGKGCQSALLTRRMNDAAKAGCELVASRCSVGSRSQHNMERAGLHTAYTKTIWETPAP